MVFLETHILFLGKCGNNAGVLQNESGIDNLHVRLIFDLGKKK